MRETGLRPHVDKGGGYMATHKLGKLTYRLNDGGLEFRWGDGEIRRIALGRNRGQQPETPYDEYADYDDEQRGDGYDDRYEGEYEDDYEGQDYADDYDDSYADDGYDDRYEDDYVDEDYPEDAYDDDYADDGYAQDDYADDGGYADGEYADDGYADYDGDDYRQDGGYAAEYPEGTLGTVLEYVDNNDWVTYLLLFILPPLGIYLLWRRQRFEQTVRWAISAASTVWFVVLLVLLVMAVFGGKQDIPGNVNLDLPSPSPSASVQPSPSASVQPSASATSAIMLNTTAASSVSPSASISSSPSATPISGGSTVNTSTSDYVWCSASGHLFHSSNACWAIESDESVSQVTFDNAKSRGKYPCPVCYGAEVYYATAGGTWYHKDKNCPGMSNAVVYSEYEAKKVGKKPCPTCITGEGKTETSDSSLGFLKSSTTDKSGIRVWWTSKGKNYHMTANCRNMSGATQGTLKNALLAGKTACATCCKQSGTLVYCTSGGSYYHTVNNCDGMNSSKAKQVTVAEALVLGKTACSKCKPVSFNNGSDTTTEPAQYYVYATKTGKSYHIKSNCKGMSGASKVLLSTMIAEGRPACEVCCAGANMTVYASTGGTYYHSYATCSNMPNAKAGTLAEALAAGYRRCSKCWSSSGEGSSGEDTDGETTADTLKVYATKDGTWYHTRSNCMGMSGASRISLRVAVEAGKKPCTTCATAALKLVYSYETGKYYHKATECTNLKNAPQRTLADALILGQTACPVCMKSSSDDNSEAGGESGVENGGDTTEPTHQFESGTSGIRVYIGDADGYFHTGKSCGGKSYASHVTLEVALNAGKKACPSCASSAGRTVYATRNGKYYHLTKSCAGSGAASGTLAQALAYGFKPCPYCVSVEESPETPEYDGSYTPGTSGINVYASPDETYYHSKKSHADSGAVKISLETAMNYDKKPCPTCCAVAGRTVYATSKNGYYHISKACAGSNAAAGTIAKALALGMTACPNCIGTTKEEIKDTVVNESDYSASADTSVYIDLYAEDFYYHKNSKCSGSGMSGGTEVTLQFVLDLGYECCPYCNPPSSVE